MGAPEIWKPIPGLEGRYEVSDLGRVRSLPGGARRARVLRPISAGRGYLTVQPCVAGLVQRKYIHHLVADVFIGPRPAGMDVCHSNGDLTDNRAENLRYDTRNGNMRDVITHGRHPELKRTTCDHGHSLSGDNVKVVVSTSTDGHPKYRRRCRTCLRAKSKHDYEVRQARLQPSAP